MDNIFFKILFGLIYTVGYFFLALMSTGGGHGNFYILLPLIPWFLLFVPIFLFGKLNDLVSRIVFVLVMLTNYAVIMIFLLNYSFTEDKGWTQNHFPYPTVIWYFAGQLIIWAEFFIEMFIRKGKKPDDLLV